MLIFKVFVFAFILLASTAFWWYNKYMALLPNFKYELFHNGLTIAVALSGGEDSVCLFHQLRLNAETLGIRVKAINVEHGLRGETSLADSAFVKSLCEKYGVELLFKRVDSRTYSRTFNLSEEEAARTLRYEVFDYAASSGFCDAVATAHHLSDNAETVLFNLFRGAAALKGISETSRGGKILRPMLGVKKEDIHAFIKSGGYDYVTDETNSSERYTRNFIRLNLIPRLKEKFPAAEEAISRFAEISAAESEFLDGLAEKRILKGLDEISISTDCPNVLFARAATLALKSMGAVKDYEKRHIDLLIALKDKQSGTTIDLIGGIKATSDYGKITLYKNESAICVQPLPYAVGETVIAGSTVIIEKYDGALAPGELYFDGDKIPPTAVIRTRKDGDTFNKFGGSRKKLKDFLIDKKIPARKRDELVLLADGSKVLIVFGIEISDDVKADEGSVNLLKCKIFATKEN